MAILRSEKDGDYFESQYQICLADAEEGGIGIAEPTARAIESASAAKEIDVTLTFNDEQVTECNQLYPTGTPIAGPTPGDCFTVTIPRYGCIITTFTTKRRIQWEE